MMRDKKGRFIKGHPFGKRYAKGHVPWTKGKPRSEEVKAKISSANKGQTAWNKGLIGVSEETYKKMSKAHKGKIAWNKGKKHIGGAKHWNWKGGITPTKKIIRMSMKMEQWRNTVFTRDDFTCQSCGEKECYLHAHHIKFFADYPESRFDVENGITLCKLCHAHIHQKLKLNPDNWESHEVMKNSI